MYSQTGGVHDFKTRSVLVLTESSSQVKFFASAACPFCFVALDTKEARLDEECLR